jgi:hypothetical protein
MSTVMRFLYFVCVATTETTPLTPPAGPDSAMETGNLLANETDERPPSERRIRKCFVFPCRDLRRLLRYNETLGLTYELATFKPLAK